MTRTWRAVLFAGLLAVSPALAGAQEPTALAGRWTLNRELSQFPKEIGFNVDWLSAPSAGGDSSPTRGGGGDSGPARSKFPVIRESSEDSARRKQLTEEVRQPPAQLNVTETATDITIAADDSSPRTFHFTAIGDVVQLDGATTSATAKRDAGKLVITYKVEQRRELRYTYSRVANPPQLVVDVQFVESGKGDSVRRVYTPAVDAAPRQAPTAVAPAPADARSAQDYDRRPDAQLKGLTKLGVVVEGLSATAEACGLKQDALESLVAKRLSGAGFPVTRNTDDDTYLYVNIMTASMASGLCVTRYDAYLYTHTTAKLEYHDTPVLVDVSLLHKGSIAAGNAAAHTDSVMRGVQEFVDQFTSRIRDANK
jgi:hypothetical protein